MTAPITAPSVEQPSPREAATAIAAALDEFCELLIKQSRADWDWELANLESERGFSCSDETADEKRHELIAAAESDERKIEARFEHLQACVDQLSYYGSTGEAIVSGAVVARGES